MKSRMLIMDDILWWRDGVIYQIYPRSFADSDGDGLGDLAGISAHLDYLADLGVAAIWLSPFYPTPDADFGYDISDHTEVDARFGTLGDFDRLLAEAHRRGIWVILDLVLNHTSDQHPWFIESRASRDNPKSDWYIWQPSTPLSSPHSGAMEGKRGANNWQAVFGGRAWTYAPERGQYYYHMFLKEQPDVNWRTPEVRKAQLDVVRFWLERGVDGFRLDVFNVYFKDAQFRDNPPKFGLRAFDRQQHIYDCDQPEMLPLLNELRAILDSYPQRYAVGETFLAMPEKAASFCSPGRLHAAFNFDFTLRHWDPAQFLDAIQRWEAAAGDTVWPNYVLGNHDLARPATRYSPAYFWNDRVFLGYLLLPSRNTQYEDDSRAKVAMAMLLTLRGTPFIYYGEEIAMRDISLRREQILDPQGKVYWPLHKGRDGCRSPMQWDDSPNAGFTTGKPWLPVHPNYCFRNAAAQRADPDSMLNLVRKLIRLRKENPALRRGTFTALTAAPRGVLAYLRQVEAQTALVALNYTDKPKALDIPWLNRASGATGESGNGWNILFSTGSPELSLRHSRLMLAPYGICILLTR